MEENPTLVIFDEVHVQPNRELLKPEGCTCPFWFVVEGCPASEHAALAGQGAVPCEELP